MQKTEDEQYRPDIKKRGISQVLRKGKPFLLYMRHQIMKMIKRQQNSQLIVPTCAGITFLIANRFSPK